MTLKMNVKSILVLAPLLLFFQPARASVPCSGAYTMDPTTGLPSTSGCEQGDKIFSQFSTYNDGGTVPSPSNVDVNFSGTNPAGPITITYSSSQWVNTTSNSTIFLYDYTQVDQTAQPGYLLTGFDMTPGAISFAGTCGTVCDSVQIIVDVCTNLNTNTCNFGSSNYGQVIYTVAAGGSPTGDVCYGTCSSGYTNGTAMVFAPALDITSIFVTNWEIIDSTDGVSLDGISNDYFEGLGGVQGSVPEPGTFLLLGTALGALSLRLAHISK
jgi:hypothetical protein